MINVPEELYGAIKDRYPDRSWTEILGLLLDDSPRTSIPENTSYVTQAQFKELKDKFNTVIDRIIELNNLSY